MHRYRTFAMAAALLAGPAWADRPLNTDTAGVKARGVCQLAAFAGREHARGAARLGFGTVEGGCGVGADSEVSAGVERSTGGGERSEGLAVGGKTHLLDFGGDDAGGVSIAYGLGWARTRGTGWAHADSRVTLVASRRLGALMLHANLGHARDHAAHHGVTLIALAGEWAFAPRWSASAEVFGDDRSRPWAATGLAFQIDEALGVFASVAAQRDSARTRQWSAGINWNF